MAERSAYALKMVLAMVVCQRVSLQCHVVVVPLGAGKAVFADRKQVFDIGGNICTCICNSRYWHPLSKLAPTQHNSFGKTGLLQPTVRCPDL